MRQAKICFSKLSVLIRGAEPPHMGMSALVPPEAIFHENHAVMLRSPLETEERNILLLECHSLVAQIHKVPPFEGAFQLKR